jgi:serine/threonine protein kinase
MLEEFRLLKVLGVGGFGITYLAVDTTLEQEVAIKEYLPNAFAVREGTLVHPKTSEERGDYTWGLERFEQEAKTLARFRHRHLVQVRRFFRGNNTAYMVMDYEDGQPLSELIKGGRQLNETEILQVLLPLLDGLEQVHAAGVLHRDIKPANIFIRRADESPVLLDFGAARQDIGRHSKGLRNF